jgi:hypothetical protein
MSKKVSCTNRVTSRYTYLKGDVPSGRTGVCCSDGHLLELGGYDSEENMLLKIQPKSKHINQAVFPHEVKASKYNTIQFNVIHNDTSSVMVLSPERL